MFATFPTLIFRANGHIFTRVSCNTSEQARTLTAGFDAVGHTVVENLLDAYALPNSAGLTQSAWNVG